MLSDNENNVVMSDTTPPIPLELDLSVVPESLPSSWPAPQEDDFQAEDYERHVFILTRGTRGDVQPFVALARGMAEENGWLVTICTEIRWKDFVVSNADVMRGRIQFVPSGGDTERKVNTEVAKWAMNQKSEFMQMVM